MAPSRRLCHFACMTDELSLAAEFPPVTEAEWRKLVEAALKGADFDKRLVSRTYDGLRIELLYPRAAGATPIAGRRPGAAWSVLQRVDHPDPAAANAQALQDLENGATGLTLVMAGSTNANGYGLDPSPETLARVLEGVKLDAGIRIDFDQGPASLSVARQFAELVRAQNVRADAVDVAAGVDPIAAFARSGHTKLSWTELSTDFVAAARELGERGFRRFAAGDGRTIHNAGGSEAQELSFTIASAVETLGARGGDLQAHAKTRVHSRGDCVANDDQTRSLCEHVAHDNRHYCSRTWRCRQHFSTASHCGPRVAGRLCAARRSQHATYSP